MDTRFYEVNFCPVWTDSFTGLETYDPNASNCYAVVQAHNPIQAEAMIRAQYNNQVRIYSSVLKG